MDTLPPDYWLPVLVIGKLDCFVGGVCFFSLPGAAGLIEEEIPEEITAEIFTADILGLPIPEPEKNRLEKTDERISSERSGKV